LTRPIDDMSIRPVPRARPSRRRRDAVIGGMCVAFILTGTAAYLLRSSLTPAPQPAAVRDADAKLREELSARNPPPSEPAGPVEVGGGRAIER
jgi:hypothetical protein